MNPSGGRLWEAIEAAERRVRRDGALAVACTVVAAVPATLIVAWLAGGGVVWEAPSAAPLVLEAALVVGAVVGAVLLGERWIAAVGEREVAAAAEEWRRLPAGSVRGVLELRRGLPAGTSSALRDRAAADLERTFGRPRPAELAGDLGERARRRRQRALMALGGAAALAAVLGFVSPERSRAGWAPLLSPVAHLSPPPLPPLEVRPGDAEVPRGGALDITIGAEGRRRVTLRWRAEGDVPRQRTLDVLETVAATRLTRVDAPVRYWVVAPDGAVSDTFRVRPIDPLLMADLVVDVVYPDYLRRPADRFEGEVPPLEVPAGTELRIRGRSTRMLARAGLAAASRPDTVAFEVVSDRFHADWVPRRGGVFEWMLVDRAGVMPALTPAPLELTVVPDSAPSVQLTFPGADTVLGPEMRQPFAARARDDHGLRSAAIVSWRISSLGERGREVSTSIPLEGAPGHATLRGLLDVTDRRLLPGDTLRYYVRVTDNSPGGQTARSEVYTLRLPSMEELRELARNEARSAVDEADALANSAHRLEEATEALARQTRGRSGRRASGTSGGGSSGQAQRSRSGGEMQYGEAAQARQVLERHEEMVRGVEELRRQTEELERSMRSAGLQDPELQQRLAELRQLYDQILTPELKKQLEELRKALDELDPERVERALEALAEQQDALRERIDQSLELLRRAAVEQRMNALAQETKEVATQQRALAESIESADSVGAEQERQQRELAQRTDALSRAIQELQRRLSEQGEDGTATRTGEVGEQIRQAREAMQNAANEAAKRRAGEAAKSGEEAADSLDAASEALAAARGAMAEAWRQDVQETVAQATGDALELAERQNALLQQMQRARRRQPSAQGQQSQQGQQQSGQQQSGQQQSGQQQGGQQQGAQQQGGQQQGGQQQGGQQQGGQQQGGQQQGGQQQGGQQQGGQQQGGQQQGGAGEQAGQGERQDHGQMARRPGGGAGGQSDGTDAMRSEQSALKQGLEALGRNLADAGRKSALLNRDVGGALGRALLSMEQTLEALQQRNAAERLPTQEAEQAVEALNRLALELLANSEQIQQSETGTGLQQALQRMSELARQQSALNGRTNSLLPLDLGPRAMSRQLQRMARAQREIARRLGGMHDRIGGREDVLGRLDMLSREADRIADELENGRLTPELLARQQRLFHRLLDAGRTLERDEVSDERVAERPSDVSADPAPALDPELTEIGPRYPLPTPQQLRALPPAYRRLILEYFDRLNRPGGGGAGASGDDGGAGAGGPGQRGPGSAGR